MCIAIPAEIVELIPGPLPMARLEAGVEPGTCCLAYVPEARVGDFVLVQNGFAITLLNADEAAQSRAAFAEFGVVLPRA